MWLVHFLPIFELEILFFIFWFLEISGPPDFLNNCVQEQASAEDVERQRRRHGGWKNRSEKELPAGKVSI